MIKSIILFPKRLFDYVYNLLFIKFYRVSIGKKRKIRGRVFIRNHGTITIGDNFVLNCDISGNPVGGPYHSSIIVDDNASLVIGNDVGISGTAIICCKGIVIDNNVMIGSGCCIYDTDFHSVNYADRINKINTKLGQVYIHEGAFIGARSIILKGVSIGRHSVVGAGSVVTKSIPENEVWAGNPAKFIRKV